MIKRTRKRANPSERRDVAALTAELLYLAADLKTANPEAAEILRVAACELDRCTWPSAEGNGYRPAELPAAAGAVAMRH